MRELMQTNDTVLLSYVEVLLRDGGVGATIFDGNMSIIEGSIGILPRRVLVADEDWHRAKAILEGAELGGWISQSGAGGDE